VPERVLVTGAAGFVGSHVAQTFVEAGYEVRCGLRASSDPRWIADLPVERVPLDLTRLEDLSLAVKNVDMIVHAAGLVKAGRTIDYGLVNTEGTRKLAVAAQEAGVRRFVLISSLAARGPDNTPARDGRDLPASAYGRSKLEAEEVLRPFGEQMEVVALRPAGIYGPRDTELLPLFKMARGGWLILPSGLQVLQPVYATDVARAALAAAGKTAVGFGPHPVAEASRYTWQNAAKGLEDVFGRTVRVVYLPAAAFKLAGRAAEKASRLFDTIPVFDERQAWDLAVHTWTCDPSSTEQALGWRAEVPLYRGLELTAHWYRRVSWI
jgi:nucleoside-diphosphate-sugar epimerase